MDEKKPSEDGIIELDDSELEGIAGGALSADVLALISSKAALAAKNGLSLDDYKSAMNVLKNRLLQRGTKIDSNEFERAIRLAWDNAHV